MFEQLFISTRLKYFPTLSFLFTDQIWYKDSNNNIRSSIDINKCIVGDGGRTTLGTKLMIYDCLSNDSRFAWDHYNDGSIRPRNNSQVCIQQQDIVTGGRPTNLILDVCKNKSKRFGFLDPKFTELLLRKLTPAEEVLMSESLSPSVSPTRDEEIELELLPLGSPEVLSSEDFDLITSTMVMTPADDNCEDSPKGWYDIMGRNCEWYSEDESNCQVYGLSYKNFGRTALSACCVCGGGPIEEDAVSCDSSDGCEIENEQGCWDQPNWYDSTGDGCSWYSAESNHCEDYGSQYRANNACCVCGGGLSEAPAQADESTPGCSDSPYNWYVPCCVSASIEFYLALILIFDFTFQLSSSSYLFSFTLGLILMDMTALGMQKKREIAL
jgi:hypothetical protein